ncbi:AlpA family transcriptional regulator [Acidovorax sp. Leaf73]|uniref:helix-turn-helix transcriptional regulator n=1 Tax=Acidovorax sp. Leaf73 TaxID=2876566 RepID=UPI001E474278|nr:AlpA family phage regulatory protein [Acidovorax sp. Leaf73]
MSSTQSNTSISPEKLLPPGSPIVMDLSGVAETLCVSVSTVQLMVRQGEFPEPRQLSGRRVGWLTIEVAAWAASRPRSTQLPPHNTGAAKPKASRAAAQPAQ